MATTTSISPPADTKTEVVPEINQAFIADRQVFWGSFTHFVTGGAIAVTLLLIAMAYFLT